MQTNLAFEGDYTPDTTPLAERILDAFPSGSYALSGLLRLLDIVETTSVPTAAVECRAQPRLLINPVFVAKHAPTSEKLLSLVMHELHHVLLGHTTLFPRATRVQNFVFDAVINGLVCRMFPQRGHTALFTDYYDADVFPQCLLRPPKGWPDGAVAEDKPALKLLTGGETPKAGTLAALPAETRALVNEVHAALYSDGGASYQEVYELLPTLIDEGAIDGVPLFGGHGEGTDGQLEEQSPVLFDIVRSIVEQWPQPPDPIRGRSLADVLAASTEAPQRVVSNRGLLRNLICKVAGHKARGVVRRARLEETAVTTAVPQHTRRSVVLRALGHEPLLHTGSIAHRRLTPSGERVHVYLDVSGSMDGIKSALYGAVLDCEDLVNPTIHLFSTRVADISTAELRRGVCQSTGGTCITCVASHMQQHAVRRAVIITDGWVGQPRGAHHNTLDAAKLGVAYLGGSTNESDLAAVADHSTKLLIGAQ